MKTFFALVQKNILYRKLWANRRELSAAITHWNERTYHQKTSRQALEKLTPREYETIMEPAHHSRPLNW
ncbi:hypothetical protein [Trueperella pyogenes]|uniref:hypothetical protein n=1 Tax=Trueperella pyogenes TaxID=1661 RepID=UPI0032492A58